MGNNFTPSNATKTVKGTREVRAALGDRDRVALLFSAVCLLVKSVYCACEL